MSKKNIRNHWNLIALDYQEKRNLSFDDVEYAAGYARESDLNLLGDIKGKRIIELGCGGAENSIILAKKGAICTFNVDDVRTEYAESSKNRAGYKKKGVGSGLLAEGSVCELNENGKFPDDWFSIPFERNTIYPTQKPEE